MPINNITQTISILPPAGRRGVDVQTQFVIKQEDFQDHLQGTTVTELNTLKDQFNSRISEINSTATTMNGYANTASTSATTATTKAGEASTSASDALSYKNQAETFKNNASTSATKASQWADNNYNVEVETGKYSAKHWSIVAQNATANKVDKVTSTDNAVVRFNGTTGEVQNSAITIDDVGNIGTGTQTFNGFGGSGFKNYIINGNFDIWQRGISQTTGGYGSADRWYFGWTSGALSVIKGQDVSPAPYSQFGNYALLGGTSLVHGYSIHKIESVRTCSGKTVTLSYCYTSVSGTNTFLSTCYLRQDFGIGGSSNVDIAAVVDTKTSIGTNQYRRVLTFNIPSIAGKTIGTNDNLSVVNGYSGTFQQAVWGFQLEEGSVATPFENRPIGLELSLCQRYYETTLNNVAPIKTTGYTAVDGILTGNTYLFKVEKRVIPTTTVYDLAKVAGNAHFQAVSSSGNGVNLSASIYALSSKGFSVGRPSSAGDVGNIIFYYTASAEL